ncbi:NlpC/P60 family protein [Actinoplanes sp. NPDC051633]|uniref:C40 family peptidase n=1 Tax=Actinoplanes sp. NPDC051633 TaxID=3155670 RepID=UPI0034155697
MTAGAIVLAVIAPTAEISDRPADAGPQPPATVESAAFDPVITINKRPERASRGVARRVTPARPPRRKAVARAASVQLKRVVRKPEQARKTVLERRSTARVKPRRKAERRMSRIGSARPGMAAVIAFARSQIGKRYGSGGEGPRYFDCSGFTKKAYARAGIRLPHSSGAQAARARSISRAEARPGDLVVGPGHVGVYMGGGMMIDAGNRRTGVVFRELYDGLHIERL